MSQRTLADVRGMTLQFIKIRGRDIIKPRPYFPVDYELNKIVDEINRHGLHSYLASCSVGEEWADHELLRGEVREFFASQAARLLDPAE